MALASYRDGHVVQDLQISEQPPPVKALKQPELAWRHRNMHLLVDLTRRRLVGIPAFERGGTSGFRHMQMATHMRCMCPYTFLDGEQQ